MSLYKHNRVFEFLTSKILDNNNNMDGAQNIDLLNWYILVILSCWVTH